MKKILLTTTLVLSSLLSSSSLAQEEVDRFTLCSKFPQNSKCENFEAPILLKDRTGEEASCQMFVGDFQKNAACKIDLKNNTLTFYQEQGDKIEQLDNQRLSIEYNIPLDRILITNSQVWNGVHRWEIGYLEDAEAQNKNSSNNLILLTNEELSQAIAANLKNPTPDDSIAMLNREKPAKLVTEVSSDMTEAIEQLVETKECIGCDLQNADLTDVDLKQANLERANLAGANLEKANLQNSYLMGANLEGANLNGADLRGAILALSQLNNATLKDAKLQAANLQAADLRRADLSEASLQAPALLQEANLTEANLEGADLRGSNFYKANLTEANLEGANLKDINIQLKNVPGYYSFGKAFLDAFIIGLPIFGATNDGVHFKTNLTEANLEGANLTEAQLEEVFVTDANFSNADFSNAKIESINFEEANFCGATFTEETPLNEVDC